MAPTAKGLAYVEAVWIQAISIDKPSTTAIMSAASGNRRESATSPVPAPRQVITVRRYDSYKPY